MKKILFAISAFALLTGISTSCQKEEAPQQDNGNQSTGFTITATIADNGTKLSYSETGEKNLKPKWEADTDIIIGFGSDNNTYGFKATSVDASGKATFTLITSGDYAGSNEAPANGTKMYMFYAPGKKPSDISNQTLTVSLASQSKDVVPALMMASGTVSAGSLTLSFENKCAIIGIKNPTMAAASKTYNSITLYGTGINTAVKFSLDGETLQANYQTAGTITKAVYFTSGSDNKTNEVTYIAVCPLTTSSDLTFVTNYLETFKKTGKTMSAGNYYYMTPTFSGGHTEGLLSGVFSVGATKVVGFSKGNLQATVDNSGMLTEWNFANDQYGYIGDDNANTSIGEDGGTVDLFGWSTDAASNNWGIHTKEEATIDWTDGSFKDWGANAIANGGDAANLWSTLSIDEWSWLLNTRKVAVGGASEASYGEGTVNDMYGLIILPDNWDGSVCSSFTYGKNDWEANVFADSTTLTWSEMESAGCVFLPAAGQREGSDVSEEIGFYWSSTPYDTNYALDLCFESNEVNPSSDASNRYCGSSVRLVSVAQ